MPDLQRIGARRDPLDSEAAVCSTYGMKGVAVNADKGFHPTMNVALNDDISWVSNGLNNLRASGSQSQIQISKAVEMNGVKNRITINGLNAAPGCQDCYMRPKSAIPVIQDKSRGWRNVAGREGNTL